MASKELTKSGKVLACLVEHGPMTILDLAAISGIPERAVRAGMATLSGRDGSTGMRRAHIVDRIPGAGHKNTARSIWAAGHGEDAPIESVRKALLAMPSVDIQDSHADCDEEAERRQQMKTLELSRIESMRYINEHLSVLRPLTANYWKVQLAHAGVRA